MNEELQSSNEELHTIIEEFRQRSEELNRANGFLESILTGLRSGVVVLDRELHVIAWNPRAEELWGLRAEEVRFQNFLNLDIGLPIEQLRAGIRACLSGDGEHQEQVVPATNRRGRAILCRVTATPLSANKEVRRGHPLDGRAGGRVHTSSLNVACYHKLNPGPAISVRGTMSYRSLVCVGLSLASALLVPAVAGAQSRPAAAPTFSKDVAPIIYKNCTVCHRPGEIGPFSMLTYAETRPWVKAIATPGRQRHHAPVARGSGLQHGSSTTAGSATPTRTPS